MSGIILKECLFPLKLKRVSLIFPWGLVCYHLLNRQHSAKVYYAHCACIPFPSVYMLKYCEIISHWSHFLLFSIKIPLGDLNTLENILHLSNNN